MPKVEYDKFYPCTADIAADLTSLSVRTAQRRLARLRKEKGYKQRAYVSIGEFLDWMHIKYNK